MSLFGSADILLPLEAAPESWAVIACDQFTSQSEYWDAAEKLAEGSPSALNLILPEARLTGDDDAAIERINKTMREYLEEGVFGTCEDAFVYVERTLKNGDIRRGLVGALDLEGYDYAADTTAPVRATEQTVRERIPPRMKIRRDAPLELPHVLLLCDDAEDAILGTAEAIKMTLPPVYDFDLMLGGGHIRGWLITGSAAEAVRNAQTRYELGVRAGYAAKGLAPVLYAVGDGNHSLASAKACYEELKAAHPGEDLSKHPARWALVELENLRDEAQSFEPIHRVVTGTDTAALLAAAKEGISAEEGPELWWYSGAEKGCLHLDCGDGRLPVAVLQEFLDAYLATHPGTIDYIHGEEAVEKLSAVEGAVGFLLPAIGKGDFFGGIAAGGVLPRKTFSMGHAEEKRYYLEARKIK